MLLILNAALAKIAPINHMPIQFYCQRKAVNHNLMYVNTNLLCINEDVKALPSEQNIHKDQAMRNDGIVQSNLNNSNTFWTMEICSKYG